MRGGHFVRSKRTVPTPLPSGVFIVQRPPSKVIDHSAARSRTAFLPAWRLVAFQTLLSRASSAASALPVAGGPASRLGQRSPARLSPICAEPDHGRQPLLPGRL